MTEAVSDRFKQLAVLAGLKKLLITSNYFDMALLRTLLEATARTEGMTTERAELLRALHCIPWSEMGPELAMETRKGGLLPIWCGYLCHKPINRRCYGH